MKSFASGLYGIATLYWVLLEGWMLLRQWGSVNRAQDRGTGRLLFVLVAAGIYADSQIAHGTSYSLPGSSDVHLVIGGFVIIFATTFRWWSIHTLGRFFRSTVMIQERHEVVTEGPYRYLRHPSYTGLLVNVLGVGIGLGSWLGLLVSMPLAFAGIYQRIRIEEQVLTSALGERYQEYMRHTRRLVPFVF